METVMFDAKKIFNEKLNELNNARGDRSCFLDNERYNKIIYEVKEAQSFRKNNQPLTTKHYRRLKRYDVMIIGDTERLIERASEKNNDSNIRYYLKLEELFEVLETAHVTMGHKKTRIMEAELKKKYCNVTRQAIDLYLLFCEQCEMKKNIPKVELVNFDENKTIKFLLQLKKEFKLNKRNNEIVVSPEIGNFDQSRASCSSATDICSEKQKIELNENNHEKRPRTLLHSSSPSKKRTKITSQEGRMKFSEAFELCQQPIELEDSTTLFSKYLSAKLNQFDPRTKSLLIQKINELIFDTEMNLYSESPYSTLSPSLSTHSTTPPPS